MPQHQPPSGLATLAGRYRSLLSGRRVLIVLDNARDAEHVRPLLPGSPDCLVVVTSRNQLTGLVTAEAAHSVGLDMLTLDEARQMLSCRLGRDRVAAEPHHADDICRQCGGLPLALAIVAARAATHPGFRLAELATELRDARGLDAFTSRDRVTEVREVFSWSYRGLSERAAWLFRLLPSHPGPDLTPAATASLAGLPVAAVRPLLAELAEAHLVAEPAPGRFTSHDLLRSYATELADAGDSAYARHAAVHRVLDHYLHTAHAARRLLELARRRIAMISGPTQIACHRDRLRAFRDAVHAAGRRDTTTVEAVAADDTFAAGAATAAELLGRTPDIDAVVAGNDAMALGALRALMQAGRRVPHDVALAGFDNISASRYSDPPLTTVYNPLYEMGATAARLLLEATEGHPLPDEPVLLPTRLVVRRSTDPTAADPDHDFLHWRTAP